VTFRLPGRSTADDFMILGADGHPRKPTTQECGVMMREGNLIWRERPLANDARRHARAMDIDIEQVKVLDKTAAFKTAVTRRFDATPWSKSASSLRAFIRDALADERIANLPGAYSSTPAACRSSCLAPKRPFPSSRRIASSAVACSPRAASRP
jgi:putative transposase